MNSRRTVIIGAALVLGAVAFLGIVFFLSTQQQRAYSNAKLVDVYKVVKEVPKGFSGDEAISEGYVKVGKMPQEYRPGTALNHIEDIKSKVAIAPLSQNQVVVDGMFVDPKTANVGFSDQVPADQVAVTASLDDVHGVAGMISPGDIVDIMMVDQPSSSGATTATNSATHMLYQNVKVAAIGTRAAPQPGDTSSTKATAATAGNSGLITFWVPADAAERIVQATQAPHSIYLALVGPNNKAVAVGPVKDSDLATSTNLTPYPNS